MTPDEQIERDMFIQTMLGTLQAGGKTLMREAQAAVRRLHDDLSRLKEAMATYLRAQLVGDPRREEIIALALTALHAAMTGEMPPELPGVSSGGPSAAQPPENASPSPTNNDGGSASSTASAKGEDKPAESLGKAANGFPLAPKGDVLAYPPQALQLCALWVLAIEPEKWRRTFAIARSIAQENRKSGLVEARHIDRDAELLKRHLREALHYLKNRSPALVERDGPHNNSVWRITEAGLAKIGLDGKGKQRAA